MLVNQSNQRITSLPSGNAAKKALFDHNYLRVADGNVQDLGGPSLIDRDRIRQSLNIGNIFTGVGVSTIYGGLDFIADRSRLLFATGSRGDSIPLRQFRTVFKSLNYSDVCYASRLLNTRSFIHERDKVQLEDNSFGISQFYQERLLWGYITALAPTLANRVVQNKAGTFSDVNKTNENFWYLFVPYDFTKNRGILVRRFFEPISVFFSLYAKYYTGVTIKVRIGSENFRRKIVFTNGDETGEILNSSNNIQTFETDLGIVFYGSGS